MTKQRITGLTQISIKREAVGSINFDTMIRNFANARQEKCHFLKKHGVRNIVTRFHLIFAFIG